MQTIYLSHFCIPIISFMQYFSVVFYTYNMQTIVGFYLVFGFFLIQKVGGIVKEGRHLVLYIELLKRYHLYPHLTDRPQMTLLHAA